MKCASEKWKEVFILNDLSFEEITESCKSNSEADTIAKIRTFIFIQLVVTNCFIIAGNIRHWNDPAPIIINYECIRD